MGLHLGLHACASMCELVNMTVQVFLPSSLSYPTPPGHAPNSRPPCGGVGGLIHPQASTWSPTRQ